MPDIKLARWAEIVALNRLRAPGATAGLSERRRQAFEELIAGVERLHTRLAEPVHSLVHSLVHSIEADAERKQ